MALYERTHCRPGHEAEPAWATGHRFNGTPTGGGIRDDDHPERIVHHPSAVRQILTTAPRKDRP